MITVKTIYEKDSARLTRREREVIISDDHGAQEALYLKEDGGKWHLVAEGIKGENPKRFPTFKTLGQWFLGEEFLK